MNKPTNSYLFFLLVSVQSSFMLLSLDHTNTVSNIQGIVVLAESDVALLESPWGDQCVDLFAFNVVQFSDSILDLSLVGLDVHNEDQRIAVFDQFHGGFCCEGVFDNGVLVQSALLGNTLGLVLGLSGVLQSIGLVEVHLGVDASSLLGNTLLKGLADGCCFASSWRKNKIKSNNKNRQKNESRVARRVDWKKFIVIGGSISREERIVSMMCLLEGGLRKQRHSVVQPYDETL